MKSDYLTQPVAERYDRALLYGRDWQLPLDSPRPQPTTAWPVENVALLDHYREWLLSGGTSPSVVAILYIPMAGHALGLNLKPHPQLDLDGDLERALEYVCAKHLSAEWIDMCQIALAKFRHFMRQQRGQVAVDFPSPNLKRYQAGLPAWLIEFLEQYQLLRQANWRPARLTAQISAFWCNHTRLWRWLCEHYSLASLSDVKRSYLLAYVDACLADGYATSTINSDLRSFNAFLLYLQGRDISIPRSLLRVPTLRQPDRLPRFLSDEQVLRLRDDLEQQVIRVTSAVQRRDALLDRAAFYLLWQGALRLGEVEELRLSDLDLNERCLMVREGKGRKDRSVCLADAMLRALREYLTVRGLGSTEHVFLYRHEPVHKDLIQRRIHAAGERSGVPVTPHRLRHTCATQLLNVGCPITSIQKLLGHRRIDSTLIYARIHDQTVADDYYNAMDKVEKGLHLLSGEADLGPAPRITPSVDPAVAELTRRLAEPELDLHLRLELVEQLRRALSSC